MVRGVDGEEGATMTGFCLGVVVGAVAFAVGRWWSDESPAHA